MRALIVSANNFEDSELLVPLYRLREIGYEVDVASQSREPIHGKHGYEVPVTKVFSEVSPDAYDVLVLPGGKAPAAIRSDKTLHDIARFFFQKGKPVAAICHGPQILVSAGLLQGKHATCYSEVAKELKEIGALYEDSEVVIDGNLITSRSPEDLPAFCRALVQKLSDWRGSRSPQTDLCC